MRAVIALGVALAACGSSSGDDASSSPPPPTAKPAAPAPVDAPIADAAPPKPTAWTFVVISDLHLPNPKRDVVDKTLRAIIAMKPRFVVVAGDSTNGNPTDGPGLIAGTPHWWKVVAEALEPLHEAHVPVLPVAGNHDSYLPAHRKYYASTFDLARWAPGFEIHSIDVTAAGKKPDPVAHAPFSYSVDVDDVHMSFVHVVHQGLDASVAAWLAADLQTDSAKKARHRIVLSHVPAHSVIIATPNTKYLASYGALLEDGKVDVYVAGHEHLVWDEDFTLPHGANLHEILAGCTPGFYNYGPSKTEAAHAKCAPTTLPGKLGAMQCTMPHGGGTFDLVRDRKGRTIELDRATFTAITVDGDKVEARPLTLDADGKPVSFYKN